MPKKLSLLRIRTPERNKIRDRARIIDDSSDEESLCEDLADVGGESSKSGARIEENITDDENLGEDLFDQEVYDEDIEDVEDGDTVETAEGAAQLREWFHYSDGGDRLAGLSSQEQDDRIERCRARLSFVLVALIQTAQKISRAALNDPEKINIYKKQCQWHGRRSNVVCRQQTVPFLEEKHKH